MSEDGTRYTFGNACSGRVDTEGNQLPYIDAIDVEIVSDEQVRLLNVTKGKYDTNVPYHRQPERHPAAARKRRGGNYKLWMAG